MRTISGKFILALFIIIQSATFIKCSNIHLAKGVSLHPLFTDHMVLQQNKPVSVWGKAERGGKVIVQIDSVSVQTEVDDKGNWMTKHPPMKSGGPHTVKVISRDTLTLSDVYVGDVWICSGQSNMEWPLFKTNNAVQELTNSDYPLIRILKVERALASRPQWECDTEGWKVSNEENNAKFSAVGYFFGRELHTTQNIPIGLIESDWGGTKVQGWIGKTAYKKMPKFYNMIQHEEAKNLVYRNIPEINRKWVAAIPGKDLGLKDSKNLWFDPLLDESGWKSMKLPVQWENTNDDSLQKYDGVVWFRVNFNLPDLWLDDDVILNLGPIDDSDSTWVNGHFVGSMENWDSLRKYTIPVKVLKAGKNQLTVRVFDYGGGGGIWALNPEELNITNQQGNSISLAGNWKYKIGIPEDTMPPHASTSIPTMLYNAMINPLIPYGIRGAIWYQGESNTQEAYQYRTLFPALIQNWRKNWRQDDFPFYYVQLANFMEAYSQPRDNDWAELREAQLMTLSTKNTGMAVAIDIGEAGNIHPRNKQEVGRRLALIARNKVFGEDIEYSGPICSSMQIEENKIRLFFNHVVEGLTTPNNAPLKGFAIAGDNKKFLWAKAQIDGNTIIVSHPKITKPVAVRYGWDANPQCNLFNSAKLPASPFRTDEWQLLTQPDK